MLFPLPDVKKPELKARFQEFGLVDAVYCSTFAKLYFENYLKAEKARNQLHGKEIFGKKITLKMAKTEKYRKITESFLEIQHQRLHPAEQPPPGASQSMLFFLFYR